MKYTHLGHLYVFALFVFLIVHNIVRDIFHVSIYAENTPGICDGKSEKGICNGSRRHAGYKCGVREP